jgi:large subunit ribosomal protein L21
MVRCGKTFALEVFGVGVCMYAIVEAGGKQHRVEVGQRVAVERIWPGAEPGSEVIFERVLVVRDEGRLRVGKPALDGVTVKGTLLRQLRGDKVHIFKKKRRKGYRKSAGHRQNLAEVRIDAIEA